MIILEDFDEQHKERYIDYLNQKKLEELEQQRQEQEEPYTLMDFIVDARWLLIIPMIVMIFIDMDPDFRGFMFFLLIIIMIFIGRLGDVVRYW